MKILGYSFYDNSFHFTMKCDASLLNNRKPFFLPDWSEDIRVVPCSVVRISKLGKHIAPKFAARYFDAIAPGLDFMAYDILPNNQSMACAFDNSLCVGEFTPPSEMDYTDIVQAISDASRIVTLRMGDLLFIDRPETPVSAIRNQLIEQEHLYCRIK